MKYNMSVDTMPSVKREFGPVTMLGVPTPSLPLPPVIKRSAFFSIDQILGNKLDTASVQPTTVVHIQPPSPTEESYGKDISDSDSFDGDVKSENDPNIESIEDIGEIDEADLVDEPPALDIETDKTESKDGKEGEKPDKQTPSYTAIIAQAILSSADKKLPLGCIYEYIAETFPEFLKKGQGWRNCVRHNLSLSECFIKAGRARNGRGNYWGIHPRYIKNFSKGDFRKRRASHRPRNRELSLGYGVGRYYPYYFNPYGGYTTTPVSQCGGGGGGGYAKSPLYAAHRPGFSVDNILSKEQRREAVAALAPPVLSNYKYWRSGEPGHISAAENRNNIRLYTPPVLSAVVPPPTSGYPGADRYGYHAAAAAAYEHSHSRGTPHHHSGPHTDCNCHKHDCRSPTR